MCGISGLISFQSQSSKLIESMTNIVRHRGPDDEGFFLYNQEQDISHVLGGADTPSSSFQSQLRYSPDSNIADSDQLYANLMLGHRRLAILDVSAAGHQPMCTPCGDYWIVYNG